MDTLKTIEDSTNDNGTVFCSYSLSNQENPEREAAGNREAKQKSAAAEIG